MPVRKLIVKTCVREVILDNDSVTITYNFTENYTKYKISKETIEEIKRQSLKKTAYNKNRCSNKLPSLPLIKTHFLYKAKLNKFDLHYKKSSKVIYDIV